MGDTLVSKGENEALLAEAGSLWGAEVVAFKRGTDDECQALVVPKGREVVSMKKLLDENRLNPERKKGTATLQTLESFIDVVKRHADAGSAIFATQTALLAVFNYHGATSRPDNPQPSGALGPRSCDHCAIYPFPFSAEWKKWIEFEGKKMVQSAFGEFIEDRLNDVLDPSLAGEKAQAFAKRLGFSLATPQEMLTLSRGLTITAEVRVSAANNLSSGETQFIFDEKHAGASGGALNVPGGFAVGLPIFDGGTRYILGARLKYKLDKNAGTVAWTFVIQEKDAALKNALEEASNRAAEETQLPLFYGTPER